MSEVRVAVEAHNVLGEGPVWDARARRLYWLDIKGGRLSWLEPVSGAVGGVAVKDQVSAVAPRACGEGLVAACKRGVGVLDPETGDFELRLVPEPDRPQNRANDGNVDLAGRFWFGTMDDGEAGASGAVYRLDADWACTRVLDGLGISNTLVCNPGGDLLYVADSPASTIQTLQIDPVTGAAGAIQPFVDTSVDGFHPDGSAVDSEGFLWNAQWGGARLVRYSPEGSVDRIVSLPTDHVSSCAFGGDDLATLYVSTARWLLSADDLARQPLAGALFAFEPGVRGLALPPFAG